MWSCAFCVVLVLVVNWDFVQLRQLPSYISPCNRSSKETFLKCVEKNLEVLRPKMKQGIPELFLPSMDPLIIPPTTINEGDQVKITFKDIEIFHIDNFLINRFDIDLEDHTVNLTVAFPELRIKSTYDVNGKFLVITLNRSGPVDGNYTNIRVHLGLKGTPYIEHDMEYLKWEKETISISVEKSHVKFENIFGNHKDIRERTNQLINENIDAIVSDLQPVLQKVVGDLVFSVVNNIFSNYSVNELFVDL